MKKDLLLATLFIVIIHSSSAQTGRIYNLDSLKNLLATDLDDTSRIRTLNNLGRNIRISDTVLLLGQQAIALSQQVGYEMGEAEALNNIAYWYNQKGNYPKALEHYLRSIKLSEGVGYEQGLVRSFNSISTVYLYIEDYVTAVHYARKARNLSIKLNDLNTQALSASWLSKGYLALHLLDSALNYAQESYEVAKRMDEPSPLYFATLRLGEINAAEKNYPLALEFLRMSLRFSKKDGRHFRIAGVHQELALVFKTLGTRDSSLWHARQSFLLSPAENLTATLFSSSLLLSELHEGINDKESLRFHKVALVARDSLFSQNKSRQVDMLSLNETLRQREIDEAKRQAEEVRRHDLQYAGIALGLVLFIILFLLLSHSIIANETVIKFLGVLALLILFEFINLLLHPMLANLTHHSPLWMLAIMVCIAALIIPLHHKLEKRIIHKLVEKNKKIRLEAAKRTIARLEGENQ